jgi:hypothetical protein
MNETGSWESEVNAMNRGQDERARRRSRDRGSRGRKNGMPMQRTAKSYRSMQAGAQLSTELSGAGNKSRDRGRQQRSDQR